MKHIDQFHSAKCLRGALITVVIDQPTEQAQQAIRVLSQKKGATHGGGGVDGG